MNRELTVVDFFCGAGGFSEGFRQQGFSVLYGIDKWESAIATFNHNFNLDCSTKDILTLCQDFKEIERIPNSDVIIGSPPCVSFSNSNKSGKADKSMGVMLTEAFLKIVAIKKFQKDSILRAWYMENVPNSIKYLKEKYSFKDLKLSEWAKERGYDEDLIVLTLSGNSFILNSAHYGAPQSRKRAITGENIELGRFSCPPFTHYLKNECTKKLKQYTKLNKIKASIPNPFNRKSSIKVQDPLYPNIKIAQNKLTDQFYDSGLYKCQWKNSRYMKQNHPFMGRMSFPENEDNPSRTITATSIGSSRESIIYKSEINRLGHGEYRTPTVREMATIMCFPFTYQFKANGIYSKTRLVGNAVCVSVSRAIARQLRKELGVSRIFRQRVQLQPNLANINNLNTYERKIFDSPPVRKKGARFRMHPFKDGNMTVTLSNYNISTKSKSSQRWYTSIQYGNGKGFPSNNYDDYFFEKIEKVILKQDSGIEFLNLLHNHFSSKIPKAKMLQKLYEKNIDQGDYKNPVNLIEELSLIIKAMEIDTVTFRQNDVNIFEHKESVPLKQLFALYAVNKITSTINKE